jgi:hypothetical protein
MGRSKQPPTKMKESDEDRSDESDENKFKDDMDDQHPDMKIAASTSPPSKPDPKTPIRTSQVKTRSSKTTNQPITHNIEIQQDWDEHTETQDVVFKVATGNKNRIVKQTEILPAGKPASINDYDICMHVYSREDEMGSRFVPTLYKTGFIDNRRLSKGMVPFRQYK